MFSLCIQCCLCLFFSMAEPRNAKKKYKNRRTELKWLPDSYFLLSRSLLFCCSVLRPSLSTEFTYVIFEKKRMSCFLLFFFSRQQKLQQKPHRQPVSNATIQKVMKSITIQKISFVLSSLLVVVVFDCVSYVDAFLQTNCGSMITNIKPSTVNILQPIDDSPLTIVNSIDSLTSTSMNISLNLGGIDITWRDVGLWITLLYIAVSVAAGLKYIIKDGWRPKL